MVPSVVAVGMAANAAPRTHSPTIAWDTSGASGKPLSSTNHPASAFAALPWLAAMNVPPTAKPARTVTAPAAKASAGSGASSARAGEATSEAARTTAGNARLRMRARVTENHSAATVRER